jgi:hypothetical protein
MPTFQKKFAESCRVCAYHESGHILFAYLCGYRCKYVELVGSENENEYSSIALIDYGKDSFLASRFNGPKASLEFFTSLQLAQKLDAIEVGQRLARIYLGGSVAAAMFRNNGNPHIPLPIQLEYTDLVQVEFVHWILKELSSTTEEHFIEHGLQEALYTISNINIWETVEDLAERLLDANQLNQNDIEECLEEHGISTNDDRLLHVEKL